MAKGKPTTAMRKDVTDTTFMHLADRLLKTTRSLMRTAKTEEDLRIGFEKGLDPILDAAGVKSHPTYERFGQGKHTVFRGRPDAVHGQVIIEYEPPGSFKSTARVDHAQEQLEDYLAAHADTGAARPLGIGFDGKSVFLLRVQPQAAKGKSKFVREGPYDFNEYSARTLLAALRALYRQPLRAERLADVFGPKSELGPKAVAALTDALEHWSNDRVKVFFEEWKRLFGIVYGQHFRAHQKREVEALASQYPVRPGIGFQELLFCIHTYFAFLMKLIAAELLGLRDSGMQDSLSNDLFHASKQELKDRLTDIEDGGVYAKRGIRNFLEGDFFRWYLDCFDSPSVQEVLREIARALSDFEPATSAIEPETTRDLLKKLYQYLVPQEVRHKLGEYYTPDWLAELLLDEVAYKGQPQRRVLDPACGSGTFLVLAIQRARQAAAKGGEQDARTAKRLLKNIWGFDLNPLAVIAARTNYLFALGDLVDQLDDFEIPVYLADSVLWPKRTGSTGTLFIGGDHLEVRTALPTPFHVPAIWLRNDGILMRKAATVVEGLIKSGYTASEAVKQLTNEGLCFPPHETVVSNFYEELLEKEREGKNGIWARFLKNAFAPMMAGLFDLVVGNPPWIRWGYLADDYRRSTVEMWKQYGLFSLKGHAARLGGGEKDFSMLFTHASADFYLKRRGKLAFLITQEVFKSKGAGEGFRRFRLGDGDPLKVNKVMDLVTVQPFEGAANKTAGVVLTKGAKTTYPVPYTVWARRKGIGRIPTDATWAEAKPLLKRDRLIAKPIDGGTGSWQTFKRGDAELSRVQGDNAYKARRGASTEPYGVFWLELVDVLASGDVLVRNMADKGKRNIRQLKDAQRIEPDLVFPAVRGADVQRWRAEPEICIVMVQDPQTSEPHPESEMKKTWPKTYEYLLKFKDILLSRGSKPVRALAERTAFYAMFGIGTYTVANYRVVWKRMASDLVAAVISQWKTPMGHKTIIPTDTTALIAAKSKEEAHYLCAIINSSMVRRFIKSYSSAGRGFGAPSVMQQVGIPKFDKNDKLHCDLSDASITLHNLAKKQDVDAIKKAEPHVDKLVAKMFKMTA